MLVLRAQQEMTNLKQLKTPLFKMQIKDVVYVCDEGRTKEPTLHLTEAYVRL